MSEHQRNPLTRPEKVEWLRLIRSENVGPITFFRLLARFGTARAALEAMPTLARRGGKRRLSVCPKAAAERELEGLERLGGALVVHGEPDYPPLLALIEGAPPVIAVLGHPHLLRKRAVAVVGARNASLNGRRFAQTLARALGEGGLLVASGLARGIDAAAHEGALETGTAAVVAGGVDVTYPKDNADLRDRIIESGVLFSEVTLGEEPQARHFPRRNRLISGMSRGVVVVEASPRSGSLITAHMALEQGREVFAVPGSPLDARARGANDLLRQGATLVESADDVLRALAGSLREPPRPPPPDGPAVPPDEADVDAARAPVIECLSPSPVHVDEIIRAAGRSPAVVSTVLLELELAGRLERHPGNRVALLAGD